MSGPRNRRDARMFESDECRKLLDAAGVHLRAMILLGLNCGFGNSDCEQLPIEAVDLETGWIRFPRPKTAVQSTRASGATEVCRSPLGNSTTQASRWASQARCWDSFMRPLRRT